MNARIQKPLSQTILSRRGVLAGGGALLVSFSLVRHGLAQEEGAAAAAPKAVKLPGSLDKTRMLDAWIRIGADNSVTVMTGKAELGQGAHTALIQLAAEELRLDPKKIRLIAPDTELTPDEGYTAGSQTMLASGNAIRNAAAQARDILVGVAAVKLEAEAATLTVADGKITAPGGKSFTFGELVSDEVLHVEAQPKSNLTDPKDLKLIGTSMQRIDIPGKVTGDPSFLQDLRLPGMLHARVVRPPSYDAKLTALDAAPVEKMPGVVKVFRSGNYLAVIAEKEFQSVKAARVLAGLAKWQGGKELPSYADIYKLLTTAPADEIVVIDTKKPDAPPPTGGKRFEAVYHRPYQMHAAIGPSCGVAHYDDGVLKVWTHNQGVFPLRQAVAELVKLPQDKVHCVSVEGSGCYGHNGGDDAGADAAFIAFNMPGKPIRVQWMRDDEHKWEPYGSAMLTKISATLDDKGEITDWNYDVWSTPHGTRPGGAKSLIAGWLKEEPFGQPPMRKPTTPESDGNRNAKTLYKLPSSRVVHHFVKAMPLRVSALRTLGAYFNDYTNETFMDELAVVAGADPVAFRLKHIDDPRAQAVIKTAAEKFGWSGDKLAVGRGRGFAYARYKNSQTYVALAVELTIDRDSGGVTLHRIVAATDSGQAVNPDGIRNQIEGGIIQGASWTLYEQVQYDKTRVTSRDWSSYPILRFSGVPETLDVHVLDQPGKPMLGAGEASQGPIGAAIANAIANATGVRIRDLPLTRERLRAAIGA
jgi:nicotinate dehydrogenase subunit B